MINSGYAVLVVYPFTFSTPSSLITPISFGEGIGGKAFVLYSFMFQSQAAEPTGLFV